MPLSCNEVIMAAAAGDADIDVRDSHLDNLDTEMLFSSSHNYETH